MKGFNSKKYLAWKVAGFIVGVIVFIAGALIAVSQSVTIDAETTKARTESKAAQGESHDPVRWVAAAEFDLLMTSPQEAAANQAPERVGPSVKVRYRPIVIRADTPARSGRMISVKLTSD